MNAVFIENMMQMRKAQKLKQTDLAAKIGVGTRQVVRYEALESKPSLEVGVQIAKALDTSLDALCGLTVEAKGQALQQLLKAAKGLSKKDMELLTDLAKRMQ